jgi:hypothetical protein
MFKNILKKKLPLKEKRQIFTTKDIHNVIINKNKLLGQGKFGEIYSRTVIFKD